MLYLFYIKSY